jgi:adenine-specific DNA-methyltransferase
MFSYAKPMNLIRLFIKFIKDENCTILDFFAGSGTTLHATMQLNAEDNGHRQCILVTNNENGICENVTYERNKRVINGYTTPKGEHVEGLHGNNLRYYKTDFISREKTLKNMRALVAASTDLLCIKNNVYTEQAIFGGRKLNPNAARYFDDGKTKMLIIYNELGVNAFADTLKDMDVEGKMLIYVFSNNGYAYKDNFEEVLDKVELCALPAAIYDAYNAVLKPMKNKETANAEVFEDEDTPIKEQSSLFFDEEGGNA